MKCPYCDYAGTKVLDSRPANENKSIRRRRECEKCNRRFTTFEMIEETPLIVIKKGGSREEFSRDKILRGLIRACEKRPVPVERLEVIVSEVEKELRTTALAEVESRDIGEIVMSQLYPVDEVAYVRFASVYRQFKDIDMFMKELNNLLSKHPLNSLRDID
ncbi:transcriptional regulator NrdR [Paenibacillus harenae]|uniref:Transcriptional repressor NrdR n=1 Tax=Paenibacillus harenae TaxID=306543 RepID=A0ABT9U3N5_PAEHA|nr:transcriptional regulator NrdR [Paenibacillus harenae]MDQ0058798.1 transcriptional repressor NrdR [Paenibacillus harenae]MDQ0114259.1 transcriptional repressor NrdR [Paenibacillus harenae]